METPPATCLFRFFYFLLNFEELKSVLFKNIKYESRDRCLTEHFGRFISLNLKSVPNKDVVQVFLNRPAPETRNENQPDY